MSASDAIPTPDFHREAILLAVSLFERYEQTGDFPLLQQSIKLLRGVLANGADRVTRYVALHTLGTDLWSLYERLEDPVALDEAVTMFEGALSLVKKEAAERLSTMANLAAVLLLRTHHRGDADLKRAVDLSRATVDATPRRDAQRGGRLGKLAGALQSLGLRTLDSSLLEESLTRYREALADTPVDSESYPAACSNLSLSLLLNHQHSASPDAVNEAVRLARQALEATPAAHPLRPRFESNLAHALHARYLAAHHDHDLHEAGELARSAFAATPEGHPNLAERLGVHARVLAALYDRQPDPEALDELIRVAEAWVRAIPAGHPNWAGAQGVLSWALAVRAFGSGNHPELITASALSRNVATSEEATVTDRVEAAWRWAAAAMILGDNPGALTAFTLAVDLLPRTASRSLQRIDQERHLGRFAGLASDAAACALDAGNAELALRLLEQGRGVLIAQALDARDDLSELRSRRRDLADELEWLRDALDPEPAIAASLVAAERRHALAERWEALLAEIRMLHGFEGFLRPPGVAELRARCAGGPVALITVSPLRCDALLLTAAGLRTLALPGVDFATIESRSEEFLRAVEVAQGGSITARKAQGTVFEILGWLWDGIVEPVFDALGLTGAPNKNQQWPRLWWVPTGPLAYLPLHAAGHHDEAGRRGARTALDRAVCSYLPTARSLPAPPGCELPAQGKNAARSALAVAMTTTPGAESLPQAESEVASLASRLRGTRVLANRQATRAAVLAALPQHRWAHFACHATSSLGDSSQSSLLLHDHETCPMAVRDIARLRLSGAELAYLSACATTRASRPLADEAVHITGAFCMAGYTHVIGTLWSIEDEIAAQISGDVYEVLTSPRADPARAATALHRAVRRVRAEHADMPTRWAAHLHVGP